MPGRAEDQCYEVVCNDRDGVCWKHEVSGLIGWHGTWTERQLRDVKMEWRCECYGSEEVLMSG